MKNRSRVRLHVGTAEIVATVNLLGLDRLPAGGSALVQFHLAEAAVTVWNQPFVIRRESPLRTLGGGRIIEPAAERIRRLDEATGRELQRLENSPPADRAAASLYRAGLRGWTIADLPRLAGVVEGEAVRAAILERQELVELRASAVKTHRLHVATLKQLAEQVAKVLAALHDKQPLRGAVPLNEVAARFMSIDAVILDAAIKQLQAGGRLTFGSAGLTLAGRGPRLSSSEQQLFDKIVESFHAAGINAPTAAECTARAKKNKDAVRQLLDLATSMGRLVAVASEYWLHASVEESAREKVAAAIRQRGPLTVSQIRELLGTTRKYAVPLCEYWDRTGLTVRRGDQRGLK